MLGNKSSMLTVKYFVAFIVANGVGTFFLRIFEKMPINIWVARILGGVIVVVTMLIIYYLWLRKAEK